jgi:phage repressor protein C with HTH and peptisase S24 domain
MPVYQFAKLRFNVSMKTISEIRRDNLLLLKEEFRTYRKISDLSGTDPAYLSQIINKHDDRGMGDELARKLEVGCGKGHGWMDQDHEIKTGNAIYGDEKLKVFQKESRMSDFFGEFDLWDGSTKLNDDEVALNLFKEVEMAGGAGRHEVIENHGLKLRFAKSTLKKRGVIEDNAACAILSGDSMEPVMPNGTTIGIDKGKTRIIDGKIYAIDHDGHFRVKMVFKLPGGGLRLSSYNKEDWPDERYSPEEARKIRIIGYVFWWSAFQD